MNCANDGGHYYDMDVSSLAIRRKRRTARLTLALAVVAGSLGVWKPASAFDLGRSAWTKVAAEFGIDPYLLYAVALVESNQGKDGMVRPSPYALHHGGRAYYPQERSEAATILRRLLNYGGNVAIGMMQISYKDHGRQVSHPEILLDPLENLRFGARVLDEGLSTNHPEIAVRIGKYNAWQQVDTARQYGQQVLLVCRRLLELARATGARPRPSMCEGAPRPRPRKGK